MRRPTKELAPVAKKEFLALDTLAGLSNGQVEATVNAAIRSALRDTEDRGGDKKPRKITIEIELLKVSESTISASVKAKTSLPPYQTEPTFGNLVLDGNVPQMEFNPHSAENPNQGTMNDLDEAA